MTPLHPRFRFSVAAMLWLTMCTASFFGGRWTLMPELAKQRNEVDLLRQSAEQLSEAMFQLQDRTVVVDVVKGDLVAIVSYKNLSHVLIRGIDCPELSEPFGPEARQFTMQFCHTREVQLHDRLWNDDGDITADLRVGGKSLRKALLKSGLARLVDAEEAGPLRDAEQSARELRQGIWASSTDELPSQSSPSLITPCGWAFGNVHHLIGAIVSASCG